VIVGAHNALRSAGLIDSLASAAGASGREQVFEVGSLIVAGTGTPQKFGTVTGLLAGELHDGAATARSLAMAPDAPAALMAATGFAQTGMSFLRGLRGAYQLVLWDDVSQEALISADHLSAQAIFYRTEGTRVYFASDISPLRRVLPRDPEPDPETIPRWITDRSLPDGLTLYRGIRRLRTGCALRITPSRCRLERVWEPRYVASQEVTIPEACEQIRHAVRRAVQRRLTTDGTTGILLSGGFDSGTLAGTALPLLRGYGQTLPAYSTIFPGEPWDESPSIRLLVDEHALPSTQLRVTGGTLRTALRFQEHWGVPQPAPGSILDTPLLTRAHDDGLRVMLDGQGGDELFAGSPYLLTDYVLGGRLGAAWRLAHRFRGTGRRLQRRQAMALVKETIVIGGLPYRFHDLRTLGRQSEYSGLDWLRPSGRRIAEALDDPWAWKRRAGGGPRWWAHLSHLLVEARELSGMQDYLRRRGAMVGIDSRQPLLTDVDLVELMLTLSPELAMSTHLDRGLAREAMRGIVPEEIRVPTRKSSYGELIRQTLTGPDLPELRRILGQDDAEVGAFVDLPRMRATFLQNPPQANDPAWPGWGHHVWALATTELWLRELALGSRFSEWVEALALEPTQVETIVRPAGGGLRASQIGI
jgi:asparagine synthase (glutamine-hydrolysing)